MKEILNRLISFPLRSQIKINFNTEEKFFQASLPIFMCRGGLPESVKEYIEKRSGRVFKPHKTFFTIVGEAVLLVQQIPFSQESLREEIDHFWQMGRKMHRMFSEIAIEEKFKTALRLDVDLFE